MKNLFPVLFTVITMMVVITGCGSNFPEPAQGKIIVAVTSEGISERFDSGVKLSCNSAELDYNERKVLLWGIGAIGSYEGWGSDWICNISIEGDKLVLRFPTNAQYGIRIGKQRHILPKLEK